LRARSVANVILELSQAKRVFRDLRSINFWDDSFVARPLSDFEEFRRLYRSEVNLPFFALIEPMAFNRDKIKLLRECGLSSLQVGIQTGSERINREIYNRQVSNTSVLAMAQNLHDLGIAVIYDIIFNNPYETRADLTETLSLLLSFPRPFLVQGFNLIFYPGTALTEKALKDGYITAKDDAEDFSTIEGKSDSPVKMMGSAEISGRFYSINYSSREKEYQNALIALLAYHYVPHGLIRFFRQSETPLKRLLLKLFTRFYLLGVKTVAPLYRLRGSGSA
jgi:radical SAM superfamily enzyme YgiQ (UPF0313 family)